MSKHESPAFNMTVQNGRLIPATAYDQERLFTWRNGAAVTVRFVEEKSRWGVRKWFAVLNRAVKECSTPWKTASEASEAIKLALGIVNLTKTVGGDFLAYPKSLTELTDPELDEAVVQMLGVIQGVTGVDPDDWKKEIADVGEDEPNEIDAPPGETIRSTEDATMDAEPVTGQSTVGSASPESAQAAEPEAGGHEAEDVPAAAPASGVQQASEADKRECLDKFLAIAAEDLPLNDRRKSIAFAKDCWKRDMPTEADFVKACMTTADKVAKGELKQDAAHKYLEGLI